jgi:DNA-binding response OmpR family regulator
MAQNDGQIEYRARMIVLLLEDQPLIAMDTEATLRRAGFATIVHVVSVDAALAWLATARPDLAVMEITLQQESCGPVAQRLAEQNVPLLFYTGANRKLIATQDYPQGVWISKPSEIEALEPQLTRLLTSA